MMGIARFHLLMEHATLLKGKAACCEWVFFALAVPAGNGPATLKKLKDVSGILPTGGSGAPMAGEQAGFVGDGGIIDFAFEGRHVRFDVNQRAAANASLTISARLLNVARTVQK